MDDVPETLTWVGAIFGAVYAALYARFASQWNYLAGLYNQIKGLEVEVHLAAKANRKDGETSLADMKAGFLEDAEELHLATKPLFATVILTWGDEDQVEAAFASGTPGRGLRFDLLMNRVEAVHARHEERVMARITRHRRRLGMSRED